ncbi:MAG: 3-oxoacid CoA-transferase subunit A [Advenella sp.]|uniref:3-oxoadipate CoA-transferase n=1 Tax=Advenella kashmirensis TaxID=310575 RepID=A0A356LEP7_9BURK|nr:3-oxoadipate CoA-transferase [Advenella kashmirensis]
MLNKTFADLETAVADVHDGATILIGGFGASGVPTELICALLDQGARDLTIVNNNAGNGPIGLSQLIEAERVSKMICSFARSSNKLQPNASAFADAYRAKRIALECVPQGTMAERMRAAGSGLGPFYTPTSYGTALAEGKEVRVEDGVGYVLEHPLKGDFAFIKAQYGDRWGNLTYRYAGRNFGPIMAMAATTTIAQVDSILPLGELPPEQIVTPGIFVKRIIEVKRDHHV